MAHNRSTVLCVDCGNVKLPGSMFYIWNYFEGKQGLCNNCNKKYGDLNEVDKLLATRYKGWMEDFRLYFKCWNHLWSKSVQINFWKHPHPENIDDDKEPYINFALCLVYEMRLYFRNWGAELQICIHKYLDNLHEQIRLKEQEIEDTKTCMKWISGGKE